MEKWPRISIVTPSFNQGRYIAETIESALSQHYPNLEHIVIDGGSSDGTLDVLKRYPHLKVVSEPDRGHADAINKGFRMATGDIGGFLNADDTLMPGALHRVAQEIDPKHGRHIVMGRCRFIDEQSRFIGVEHPSQFTSHRRVLQVWKGHTIPQPATFWTPEVWRECGPMDESLKFAWIDYDLFCRFSRKYRFWCIDLVLATYRLHSESKTGAWTEAKRLEESIQISRRYWGKPWSLNYWYLALSLGWRRFDRVGRARRWLRQAQDEGRLRRVLPTIGYGAAGGLLAPEVVFYVAVYPFLRNHTKGFLRRVIGYLGGMKGTYPQTAVYLDRTEPWGDGWIGPRLVINQDSELGAQLVRIRGETTLKYLNEPLILQVYVDDHSIGQASIAHNDSFDLKFSVPQPLLSGSHKVEIRASTWFVPHRLTRNGDFRPLVWRLDDVRFS